MSALCRIYASFVCILCNVYADLCILYAEFMQFHAQLYMFIHILCKYYAYAFYAILCAYYVHALCNFMHTLMQFRQVHKLHDNAIYAPGTLLRLMHLESSLPVSLPVWSPGVSLEPKQRACQ
jgi:hypothetical protein